MLFLIHINDLFKASSNLTPVIFADDTNLFLSGKNIETLFQSMNRELQKAKVWFKANKLSLKKSQNSLEYFWIKTFRGNLILIRFVQIYLKVLGYYIRLEEF